MPLGSEHLNSCDDSLRFLFYRHILSGVLTHLPAVPDTKDKSNVEWSNWRE